MQIKKLIGRTAAFIMSMTALCVYGIGGTTASAETERRSFWSDMIGTDNSGNIEIDEVNFPDSNFRQYVLQKLDKDGNGILSAAEAADINGSIDVSGRKIKSLEGIEYFTNLKTLNCSTNHIASLDVKSNTALEYLDCRNNSLTYLDISGNTKLKYLDCSINKLTSLNTENNTELEGLCCSNNCLTSLDLSRNTLIKSFDCMYNEYNIGSVVGSYSLSNLASGGFKPAKATKWANARYIASKNTITDFESKEISYYYDCGNSCVAFFKLVAKSYTEAPEIAIDGKNFPDIIFRAYVSERFDLNKNGSLSESEIAEITGTINVDKKGITTLKGIEFFTELTGLSCQFNLISQLDLSQNTSLTYLNCYYNQLTELDLSSNTALKTLDCSVNQLKCLDLSRNTALTSLKCSSNELTSLNLEKNTKLTASNFECNNNEFNIGDINVLYKLSQLEKYGFDPHKASGWKNAKYNAANNSLYEFTEYSPVEYTYDCGNNKTAVFLLVPDSVVTDIESPEITRADGGDGFVSLEWTEVEGAQRYGVLYRPKGTIAYTLAEITNSNSFTVYGLTNGKEYAFVVRAYNGIKWTAIENKKFATPKTLAVNPTISRILPASERVFLTWDPVDGAEKYAVLYRYAAPNSPYTTYKITDDTEATVLNLQNDQNYAFVVRAYINGKWTKFNSDYIEYAKPTPNPLIKTIAEGNGKIGLTWNRVSGASRYAVLYRAGRTGSYTVADYNITGTSFVLSNLTNDNQYSLVVRAYINGKWTSYNALHIKYATPSAAKGDIIEENFLTDGFTDNDFFFDYGDLSGFDSILPNDEETPVLYA